MEQKQLWINGEWVQAAGQYQLTAPYTGEIIASIGKASPEQVEKAI